LQSINGDLLFLAAISEIGFIFSFRFCSATGYRNVCANKTNHIITRTGIET
jgi:hypothetical protein